MRFLMAVRGVAFRIIFVCFTTVCELRRLRSMDDFE